MKKFILTIAGGGSTYTPDMMETLCLLKREFPLMKIILYDNDLQRQAIVGHYGEVLFREYYEELEEFIFTTDEKIAFKEADFIFVQIRPGGLKMREKDEKIPLKYGIPGQETCGPGGLSYGMRSILAMEKLIRAIRNFNQESFIINYSNPAAIIAEAVKILFPTDKKIINICDMPISMMDILTPLANKTRASVEPRYFGLNHFGWFTHLYDKTTGEDLLPVILEKIKDGSYIEKLSIAAKNDDYWTFTFHHLRKMVKDFPHTLPNTYMQYYLYPKAMFTTMDKNYTRANAVIEGREKRVFHYCQEISKTQKIIGTKYDLFQKYKSQDTNSVSIAHNDAHAAYAVELAMSIANNKKEIFLLLTKNVGIIKNIDSQMMLETPCLVGSSGVEPLHIGEIPAFEKGLMESQYASEKLLVEAVLENSYEKALKAFVVNRMIVDTEVAKQLLDDFIQVNREYYPKLM